MGALLFAQSFFWGGRNGWRRQWHPTSVLLPEKSHGRRSLVGCSPWGRTESDTTEATAAAAEIGQGNRLGVIPIISHTDFYIGKEIVKEIQQLNANTGPSSRHNPCACSEIRAFS